MTNREIIARESFALAQAGIIGTTPEGLPEALHTFQGWKERGYIVKKGEHARASFVIWKQGKGKTTTDENGDEITTGGRMFMKKSFFFTREQVTPIEAPTATATA